MDDMKVIRIKAKVKWMDKGDWVLKNSSKQLVNKVEAQL